MNLRGTLAVILSLVLLLVAGTLTPGAPRAAARAPVIVAAGDIACENAPCQDQIDTANLIRDIDPRAVLAIGDAQYPHGEYQQYLASYDPTWGRFRRRTYPVPGNHDYGGGQNAAGYFRYFGRRANAPRGWYSFNIGRWHIVALNSKQGERPGRRQVRWLKRDLQADRHRCELAFYHYPRWSSGAHEGSNASMAPFWETLSNHGVDVVLGAHDHNYERFAPMGASGASRSRGTMQFVVGTGGRSLNPFDQPLATSRFRLTEFGLLKLKLRPRSFSWAFMRTDGMVADPGRRDCHA